MKLCVLVKEVPGTGARRRLLPGTGRLDRSGQKAMNPFDAAAIEAALRAREAGTPDVAEIVAVTMGPPSAARVLRRALSLGADRATHLCDPALAGSCAVTTGYALARVLRAEAPDLVLLGQQSDDGECYSMAAIVAEHLGLPSVTQAVDMELSERVVRCERQAEYGYDTVELDLPAVVSVDVAANEPRYPSLKAVMAARGRPLETLSTADAGIDPERVGARGSGTVVLGLRAPARRPAGEIIEDRDTAATVDRVMAWLEERRLLR